MKSLLDLIKSDPNISQQFKSTLPIDQCDCGSTEIYKTSAVTVCEDGIPQTVIDKPICEECYYDQLGEV